METIPFDQDSSNLLKQSPRNMCSNKLCRDSQSYICTDEIMSISDVFLTHSGIVEIYFA